MFSEMSINNVIWESFSNTIPTKNLRVPTKQANVEFSPLKVKSLDSKILFQRLARWKLSNTAPFPGLTNPHIYQWLTLYKVLYYDKATTIKTGFIGIKVNETKPETVYTLGGGGYVRSPTVAS